MENKDQKEPVQTETSSSCPSAWIKDQELADKAYEKFLGLDSKGEEDQKGWQERFDEEFPEVLKYLPDEENHRYKFLFERIDKKIKIFIHQVEQEAYERGRQSVLDDMLGNKIGK